MLQEWLQKNLVPCGTKYFKKHFEIPIKNGTNK